MKLVANVLRTLISGRRAYVVRCVVMVDFWKDILLWNNVLKLTSGITNMFLGSKSSIADLHRFDVEVLTRISGILDIILKLCVGEQRAAMNWTALSTAAGSMSKRRMILSLKLLSWWLESHEAHGFCLANEDATVFRFLGSSAFWVNWFRGLLKHN